MEIPQKYIKKRVLQGVNQNPPKIFFDSFELKEGSIFSNLVQKTLGLFDFELGRYMFLKSAYNFWTILYAKKPDKVPENWRWIMDHIGFEATEANPFSRAVYSTGGKTVIAN